MSNVTWISDAKPRDKSLRVLALPNGWYRLQYRINDEWISVAVVPKKHLPQGVTIVGNA